MRAGRHMYDGQLPWPPARCVFQSSIIDRMIFRRERRFLYSGVHSAGDAAPLFPRRPGVLFYRSPARRQVATASTDATRLRRPKTGID